jgi:uncharacterized phiE125 gp8 family phage protein
VSTATAVRRSIRRSAGPAIEPLTVALAKQQTRALEDVSAEDELFTEYVRAAREAFESYTHRGALTQTWVLTQDAFEDAIVLPMAAPLQSVTSVKYYDTAGTQQTLATSYYRVDTESAPGRVVLKPGQCWPDVQCERGQAVEITYVVGWTTPAAMPASARMGILQTVAHMWENRNAVQIGIGVAAVEVPLTYAWLWDPLVVGWEA